MEGVSNRIVTIADTRPYTYVYFHMPTDNLHASEKNDYYFVFPGVIVDWED